ncbi:MAG: TrkA C-terminal domain-containing protein [Eubacteriales bacterium]|nr:TrkA C-terminal domain-containing protein [Eubacteriales bacterium]
MAAVPIFLVARSSWMNGVTIAMEKRFVANFSERTLVKAKRDRMERKDYRWLNESLYVSEFEIIDPDFRKTIIEFTRRHDFVVTIIRIIRGNKFINMPSAKDIIQHGDILQMVGTLDEVDACTMLLERDNAIEYTVAKDRMLKDFIYGQRFEGMPEEKEMVCVPIKLDGNSQFTRKSIRNCGIREATTGTILGIEREHLPMVSPDIDTVLRKDDIIWLIGDRYMIDKLIRMGMMDE